MAKYLILQVRIEDDSDSRNHVVAQRAFDLDGLRRTDLGYGIIRETVTEMFRAVNQASEEKSNG